MAEFPDYKYRPRKRSKVRLLNMITVTLLLR